MNNFRFRSRSTSHRVTIQSENKRRLRLGAQLRVHGQDPGARLDLLVQERGEKSHQRPKESDWRGQSARAEASKRVQSGLVLVLSRLCGAQGRREARGANQGARRLLLRRGGNEIAATVGQLNAIRVQPSGARIQRTSLQNVARLSHLTYHIDFSYLSSYHICLELYFIYSIPKIANIQRRSKSKQIIDARKFF